MTFNTSDKTVAKTRGWIAPHGADPFNHTVDGSAIHGGYFQMDAITHVKDNLWHGGFIENLDLNGHFDTIVSMYPWERYDFKGETYAFEMYDGFEVDEKTLNDAVEVAATELDNGKRVLVHCQAGLNRSSLVVVRLLMREGMSADDAIKMLREKRSPQVLCNLTFERYLRAL